MKRKIYYLMHLSPFLCPHRLPPWPTLWNQYHGAWAELGRKVLELAEQILFSVQVRAKTEYSYLNVNVDYKHTYAYTC